VSTDPTSKFGIWEPRPHPFLMFHLP